MQILISVSLDKENKRKPNYFSTRPSCIKNLIIIKDIFFFIFFYPTSKVWYFITDCGKDVSSLLNTFSSVCITK